MTVAIGKTCFSAFALFVAAACVAAQPFERYQTVIDRKQKRHGKQQHIEKHEDASKPPAKNDTQNCNNQKSTNAKANSVNQNSAVHNSFDLIRKHLQIRFGNGDQHSKSKANNQQEYELTLTG